MKITDSMRWIALASLPLFGALVACSDDDSGTDPGEGDASGSDGGSSVDSGPGADPGSPDWTMLGYGPASTFHNPHETDISVETAPNLQVAWTQDLGASISSTPLLVGDRLFVAANGVLAFDAATGEMLWENPEPGGVTSTLAYSDGVVYVHSGGGFLHALDADTGEQQWQIDTTDQEGVAGFSSPTVAGDLVIIGGSTLQEVVSGVDPVFRGFVFAVDKDSGELEWNEYMVPEGQTGASLWSSVSIDPDEGRVYAGTGNNYTEPATDTSDAIVALDSASGEILWKNQRYEGDTWSFANLTGGPDYDFGTNPVLFDSEVDGEMTALVAAGQKSGDMHVLRRDDGTEVCSRNLGPGSQAGDRGIFNNGAWDGERLLFAENGQTSDAPGSEPQDSSIGPAVLFAIDPATCDIIWERQLPGVVMGPITVANGVGFVPADKHLEAFDVETGELLFKHTMEDEATIASGASIAHGRVAFGSGLSYFFGNTGKLLTVLELP